MKICLMILWLSSTTLMHGMEKIVFRTLTKEDLQKEVHRARSETIMKELCPLQMNTQEEYSDIDDLRKLTQLSCKEDTTRSTFFGPDNKLFAVNKTNVGTDFLHYKCAQYGEAWELHGKVYAWHYTPKSDYFVEMSEDAENEQTKITIRKLTDCKITESKRDLPFCINKIAYDHENKRLFLATKIMSCFAGDEAGLFVLDDGKDEVRRIATESYSNHFCELYPVKNNSLLTVQNLGTITEWDLAASEPAKRRIYKFPIHSHFELILPSGGFFADLSADESKLLVGICQPTSRFTLINREGKQVDFLSNILDLEDHRPMTALKLLPNNRQFIAVRSALHTVGEPFAQQNKKYTVQLWDFDKQKNVAEFSVPDSNNYCKKLSISSDGAQIIAGNYRWNIAQILRMKEILLKDPAKSCQDYDQLVGLKGEKAHLVTAKDKINLLKKLDAK